MKDRIDEIQDQVPQEFSGVLLALMNLLAFSPHALRRFAVAWLVKYSPDIVREELRIAAPPQPAPLVCMSSLRKRRRTAR